MDNPEKVASRRITKQKQNIILIIELRPFMTKFTYILLCFVCRTLVTVMKLAPYYFTGHVYIAHVTT
jgi:hypothetical protein